MTVNIFGPFWPYLRPYRRKIALGLALIALAQVVATAIPYALKIAVDTLKEGFEARHQIPAFEQVILRDILLYAGIILGLALVQMGLQMAMRWYLNALSRYVEYDIRRDFFEHLLRLSLNYFHRTPTGDLISRATNDVNAVRMFLGFGIRMLFDALLALALGMAVMCAIDWQLALYALVPMPLLALLMNRVAAGIHVGFRDVQEQFSRISARVQENLSGIRVVKAYVQREGEMAIFDRLNREYLEKSRKLIHIESIIRPLAFMVSGASLVVILWLGGERVLNGQLSLGDFVAFNAYLAKLIFPMILLGWMIDRYQRGMASMTRINEILSVQPEIADSDTVRPVSDIRGEISFQNMSFAYNGTPVLHNINLHIPSGSTLAVVGRVGSGKTTLGRLIPRLIQTDAGEVLIDGVPVADIPLQTLRAGIGYVPQETFLFSDTLRENIALGRPEASEADVNWAAEAARLSNDLQDFPLGLDTVVGERGVTLSGGQKQRTALARAVIRRPEILILDDAMASVDTHTEEEILERLRGVMAERTTILISHRISTVQGADQIVVLDEGHIVEQGTHAELVALEGIYAEMHRRQQLTQELDEI